MVVHIYWSHRLTHNIIKYINLISPSTLVKPIFTTYQISVFKHLPLFYSDKSEQTTDKPLTYLKSFQSEQESSKSVGRFSSTRSESSFVKWPVRIPWLAIGCSSPYELDQWFGEVWEREERFSCDQFGYKENVHSVLISVCTFLVKAHFNFDIKKKKKKCVVTSDIFYKQRDFLYENLRFTKNMYLECTTNFDEIIHFSYLSNIL